MLTDFSCGVIPYRVVEGRREFLLIQHKAGHWAFPKGHPEDAEEHADTARRELEEETGLGHVELDESHPFEEAYTFTKRSGRQVSKRVVYFLGRVEPGQSIRPQLSEVADGSLLISELMRASESELLVLSGLLSAEPPPFLTMMFAILVRCPM